MMRLHFMNILELENCRPEMMGKCKGVVKFLFKTAKQSVYFSICHRLYTALFNQFVMQSQSALFVNVQFQINSWNRGKERQNVYKAYDRVFRWNLLKVCTSDYNLQWTRYSKQESIDKPCVDELLLCFCLILILKMITDPPANTRVLYRSDASPFI
jgi:hypothetical protein